MTRENKNLCNGFIGKGQIRCIHLNIYIPMHYFFPFVFQLCYHQT